MLIQEILDEWKLDATIDETIINKEICKTPALHSKYLSYFVHFKHELANLEAQYYRLGNIKRRYFKGEMTKDELVKFGWTQFQGLKPSLSELNAHMEYDNDLNKFVEKIAAVKTAVTSMEYIMKSLAGRDYSIKTLTDYNRYLSGN